MVLKGKGTIYRHVKGKMYVYVPAGVRDDSQFPFNLMFYKHNKNKK
jgi:hypothetical protein